MLPASEHVALHRMVYVLAVSLATWSNNYVLFWGFFFYGVSHHNRARHR